MRSTVLVAVALCCLMTLGVRQAEAQNFVEVFGGYSYVRGSVPVSSTIFCPELTCPVVTNTDHINLNGWEVAGTVNPWHWIGITADFSGHYGSAGSSSTHLHTYLFGPKLTYHGPVAPFAHALFGVAHESVGTGTTGAGITVPTSGSAFALALGAGIDIKIAPFLSFRPIQIDYLLTRFNSSTQSQPRYSIGLTAHF